MRTMNSKVSEEQLLATTAPELDAAVSRALSRVPPVAIPPDFATRVACRAAAQPGSLPSRLDGWGPRLVLASGAFLTAAMFALAPHAAPTLSSVRFDAELVLFAELSGLLLFAPRLFVRD